MRLISASIAATAVITAVPAAIKPRMAAETRDPFACFESLFDEGSGQRPGKSDAEHDRKTTDLVLQGHPLADQLLARDDQRANTVGRKRLHMHGLEEACAGQMRQTSRVVAVGLVSCERLERLICLPALDTDDGQTELTQAVIENRRHSARLEHNATTTRRFRQFFRDRLRRRRRLTLVNDYTLAIENADARLVHRDVEASKMVH